MVDTQSLELLTDPLVIPSPIAPITPSLQYSLAPIPATPATALTVNTALPSTIAPRLKTVSAVPNLRRYVGPGLTRMHPYYYVQYVPLSMKQDLVCYTFCCSFTLLINPYLTNGFSHYYHLKGASGVIMKFYSNFR